MDANTTPAPSGEYVRRSDDRALAAAHTKIADQSTTIEAAFMAKCEAERALEAAQAERDALKAQLDPESVQHWDAMRAERDALKAYLHATNKSVGVLMESVNMLRSERDAARAEVERLRGEVDQTLIAQAFAQRDALRARVAELEAAVREIAQHMTVVELDFNNGSPRQRWLQFIEDDAALVSAETAAVLRSVVETKEKKP